MALHKILRNLLIAFFTTGMWAACTYNQLPVPEVPEEVSFSEDVIPVFDAKCNTAGCHNQGGIPPDLSAQNAWVDLVFGAYVDTTDAETSILYQKILPSGSMGKFASDNDRTIILKWIEQGAKND